jgi:hypothetical protein
MQITIVKKYYQIEKLLKDVKDVHDHVKKNKDCDTVLANDIIYGLLDEAYIELKSMSDLSMSDLSMSDLSMSDLSKSTKNINYNDCIITLLAALSIDVCEAIISNSDDTIINNFYDRWRVVYTKAKFV